MALKKQKENAHVLLLKRKLYETSTFVKAHTKIKKWGAREYFCLETCKYKCMGQFRKIFIDASPGSKKSMFINHPGGL